jgi:hypothetical protein
MTYAYAHLFHSDGRHSENPSDFLRLLEDSFAHMPDMFDSDKCYRFYLNCKADLDAEYWYEELESNSPMILTSWATFVKHFHVKWLGAPPSSLLEPEPVISKKQTQPHRSHAQRLPPPLQLPFPHPLTQPHLPSTRPQHRNDSIA